MRGGAGLAPRGLLSLALALVLAARCVTGHGVHPLSRIAVHRARVALDASAAVRASPKLLGSRGEDTAWVTVDFQVPHASEDDWIGVFSPSEFNASTCPSFQGSGQIPGPAICSAPVKYQFANYSSGYAQSGKGALKFQLINQRQDFTFGLFTGGLSNPTLVAVSNKIAFANPKAPVYPRLALGRTWNEMTVTWTSGYDISEANSIVEWGMKGSPPVRTTADTATFGRERLCGEPASSAGWRDPGFIHTAFLKNLRPDKEYYYKIGHTQIHSIMEKLYGASLNLSKHLVIWDKGHCSGLLFSVTWGRPRGMAATNIRISSPHRLTPRTQCSGTLTTRTSCSTSATSPTLTGTSRSGISSRSRSSRSPLESPT